jgi:hypothetical protein
VAEGRDGFARKKKEGNLRGGGRFLVSSWSFPHWPSSRPSFPIEPHPCFFRRGHASTPWARRGVRSARNRRPSASSCRPNYGRGFPRRAEIWFPGCPESRACPIRGNNFTQVGSGHEKRTVRRGGKSPGVRQHICKKKIF